MHLIELTVRVHQRDGAWYVVKISSTGARLSLCPARQNRVHPTSSRYQHCHVQQRTTMSRASTTARPLSLTEELEKLEQQITLTLQGMFRSSNIFVY